MKSKDVIDVLMREGWVRQDQTGGSHRKYKHPEKGGMTIIPYPKKNLPIDTIKAIERQTGLKLR